MALNQQYNTSPDLTTEDSTPTDVAVADIVDENTCSIAARVIARSADGVSALWEIRGCVKRVNGSNATLVPVGTNAVISSSKDLGATLWNFAVVVEDDQLFFRCTGDAFQNVGWHFIGDVYGFINP